MVEIREDAIKQIEKRHKSIIIMEPEEVEKFPVYVAPFTKEDIKAFQMLYKSAKAIDLIRIEILSRMKRTEDRTKYFGLSEALNAIDEIERSYIESEG